MTTTVERSAGSRSMYQVNASLARMYATPVVFIFPTLGPRLPRRQGHWSPAGGLRDRLGGPQVPPGSAWITVISVNRKPQLSLENMDQYSGNRLLVSYFKCSLGADAGKQQPKARRPRVAREPASDSAARPIRKEAVS